MIPSRPILAVETPYRDFLTFWQAASARPVDEQRALWRERYADRHPALFEHYARHFGGDELLAEALPRYRDVADGLDERFEALGLQDATARVSELYDAPAGGRAIALVGMFTADAWVDRFEGAPTAFFALEQLDFAPWDAVPTVHELTHVAHWQLRRAEWPDHVPGLFLLMEGLAVATTRRLLPEAPPEAHFAVPDYATYAAACDADWPRIAAALLAGLDVADEAQERRFFWPDWGRRLDDVPERVGYFAGARVVEAMLAAHDLRTIARWPAERALAEVRAALAAL